MIKKIFIYYSFIVVTLITLISFLRAESVAQIVSGCIFFPLFAHLAGLVIPKKKKKTHIAPTDQKENQNSDATVSLVTSTEQELDPTEYGEVVQDKLDDDRRVFLKIVASAGTGLLMTTLFTKKAHAAFFGSVPGPGTISVKDSSGSLIDPAIKAPTDGYKISEVDDTSSPAYYGFVDKTGAWFIMKEDSSGAYRYANGTSSFSSNWTGRAVLTYGYFDAIF